MFQEHCFFCWFPMALAPSDLGRVYCYSYTGLKIDTSLATNQINYYPCLYNVFHMQILTPVCEVCTISKFLPLSVECTLYSNLAFVCALCTIFTVTDNPSASSEHADNGAALLLRGLFFSFRSRTMERVLKVWGQH